jgi:peptidoglycan-associated lipoprotein
MHLRIAVFVVALVALAACSSSPDMSSNGTGSGSGADANGGGYGNGQGLNGQNGGATPLSGPGSAADLQQNVGDRVFFKTDQSGVDPEGQKTLQRQADWLKRYPNVTVTIEGHCDERGTREYNLALGARRSNSVRDFLVSHGVNPARITTISYGKERPIDPGTGEEAWAHNRNGHTAITGGAR